MKYIRNFNEELSPSVYRRAASRFRDYNKDKKSKDLLDWADKVEFGYYNMTVVNDSSIIVKNATFTNPKLIGIYYGRANDTTGRRDTGQNLLKISDDDSESLANKLVNNWKEGTDELCVAFEFGLQATNNVKTKHKYLSEPASQAQRWEIGQSVPMFCINLYLSNCYDGLEEWDSDSKWRAESKGEEFEPTSLYDFYRESAGETMTLTRPNNHLYYGLFSDRASAFKFVNFLKKLINDDTNLGLKESFLKIKDKLMDILTIVGGESEDLERILKSFSKIRMHGLYDNEVLTSNNGNLSRKWFNNPIE
jgi:hypothetical protein